jgi:eukaryotic-like serine/threonine-protein kinase
MSALDAAAVAQLAVKVGLLDDHVAKEALYELEDRSLPGEAFTKLLERKRLLTPLQSGRLLKGETDGYFLGGYRLLYKIASGSFGRVYRADDPRSGQIVAVKILRKKWTEDAKKVDLFEREGKLGLTLQHPNIVSILAVSKDQTTGQYYIVMEFIEGGNLRDIMSIRKKLELDEGLRILEECAAGMAFAFTKNLTHRDIKPTNILIATDKVARLVDFGLAEMSHGPAQMTSHAPIGASKDDIEVDRTVDYAGLERLTNSKKGDPRSDIYFLGTVLFEVITGHAILPPTRDRAAANSRARYDLDVQVRRMGAEFGLPQQVIQLLAKMVAFDANQRFQNPQLLHDAIKQVREELAGGKAVAARSVSGPPTIFVVETNPKLQDVFREKFKKMGFRVLISIDPAQALRRYQSQPYHAFLIDAGTVSRDGVDAYEKVLREADNMALDCAGILILNEDQAGWKESIRPHKGGHVFVRPVTMKQLSEVYRAALGVEGTEE